MSDEEATLTTWKKTYPFNISDEEWLRQVADECDMMGYSQSAKEELLRTHRRSIDHNKKDRSTLTPKV